MPKTSGSTKIISGNRAPEFATIATMHALKINSSEIGPYLHIHGRKQISKVIIISFTCCYTVIIAIDRYNTYDDKVPHAHESLDMLTLSGPVKGLLER